jgi:hypothetical protein
MIPYCKGSEGLYAVILEINAREPMSVNLIIQTINIDHHVFVLSGCVNAITEFGNSHEYASPLPVVIMAPRT